MGKKIAVGLFALGLGLFGGSSAAVAQGRPSEHPSQGTTHAETDGHCHDVHASDNNNAGFDVSAPADHTAHQHNHGQFHAEGCS